MAQTEVYFEMEGSTDPNCMPSNGRELEITADWTNDKAEQEINLTSLNFVREDAKVLFNRKDSGLSGGVGIFEGVPYKIRVETGSENSVVFNGFVDLTKAAKFISCNEVEASLEAYQSVDWLNEVADSFSFSYLASDEGGNLIKNSDYIKIPYVLNYRPEAFALITLAITIFITVKELAQAIETVTKDIANFIAVINVGLAFDLGDAISAGVKAAISIIYALTVALALGSLIRELVQQLFPPIRKHKGILIKTLFQKGCEHLNLTFESSIFDDPKYKNLSFMPSKYEAGTRLGNGTGHPNAKSSIYTFGDLIRVFKTVFNADIKINNGILRFERWDRFNSTSAYTMPNVETNQSDRLSELQYNTEELVSNYLISMQTDVQDQNTLDNFLGTNYQAITTYSTAINPDMTVIKGLGQIPLPFARAIRKNKLTIVEKSLKTVAKAIDNITKVLGNGSRISASISNRVGMVSLSADTTTVDKLLIINNENIPASINDQLQAKNFWYDFHFINSFIPTLDTSDGLLKHNQQLLFKDIEIPFCHADYLTLIGNNRFKTADNQTGEILTLNWSPYKNKATISYKINQVYTNNLKLAFNEGS
tara:strand:- start:650 stop:2431 length:1782 start_codon:yes stop_codon:yes gene_type:complete